MKTIPTLFAALVIVFCNAINVLGGEAGTRTPPTAQLKLEAQVKALVDRLGSEEYRQRKNAQKQLIQLGEPIRPLLGPYAQSTDAEVRYRIQQIYESLRLASYKQHAERVRQLETILEAQPDNHQVRAALAWKYYYNLGEMDRAADHFKALINNGAVPAVIRSSAYNGLGEILRKRGNIDQSIEQHTQGVALLATTVGCHNLAWVYNTWRKDFKRAITLGEQALQLGPTYEYGKISLAIFLVNDGQLDRAKKLIKGVDTSPTVRHYNLACYYAVTKQKEKAIRFLRTYLYRYHVVIKKRNEMRAYMLKDWHLDSLRDDSTFKKLMRDDPAFEKPMPDDSPGKNPAPSKKK